VLCSILGIERELEDEILYITDHVFDREDASLTQEEKDQAAAELGTRTFALFDAIIQDRRANPRDDLATMLATAVLPNGEAMGPAETLGYYLIVFTAGHDTTKFALAGAADLFLDNPVEFQRLRADRSLLMTATEEVVRCIAPVNYAKRTVMADYQLGDVHLREGDRVALFYGAANRDPAVFEHPERFDVGRDPNRHLGFGWAEHYCLGAHLARASIAAVLDVMTTRIESLERAGAPTYSPGTLVHGHKTMPVTARWA
jgi:cytochrome P450